MAGGLFGKPFAINIKCVIFSLICMALFLYKPAFSNNYMLYGTLFVIFTVAYVAMAWYDFFFDCRILPLRKGEFSWQKLIKPPAHDEKKQKEWACEEDKSTRSMLINLSHIFFIVPLLAYIVLYRKTVNPIIYPLLGVLAMFTFGYHGVFLLRDS